LADTKFETIPTPMKLQWRRVRYQVLPITVFVIALCATIYLWKHHVVSPHGLGEVSSNSVKVAATLDGKLAEAADYPRLYDRVLPGAILARIEVGQLTEQFARAGEVLDAKRIELDDAKKALTAAGNDKAKADPLKAQVATLERTVKEHLSEFDRLKKKIAAATLVAPVGGTITAIHHLPNEYVKEGQDVMTITQESGGYIVTYVRPNAAVPKKDQRVTVRAQDSLKSAVSIVQEVGTQVQLIPDHQLMNPKKPEWGIPVRSAMPLPSELPLRPGELVVLNYEQQAN
jgi:multidrug resistance efflux pump